MFNTGEDESAIRCNHCQKLHWVRPDQAGRHITCVACGQLFLIPDVDGFVRAMTPTGEDAVPNPFADLDGPARLNSPPVVVSRPAAPDDSRSEPVPCPQCGARPDPAALNLPFLNCAACGHCYTPAPDRPDVNPVRYVTSITINRPPARQEPMRWPRVFDLPGHLRPSMAWGTRVGYAVLVYAVGLVAAAASLALSIWLATSVWGGHPSSDLAKWWVIGAGVPLLMAHAYARRILARWAVEIKDEDRQRPPVLLLRSFSDDDLVVGTTQNVIGSWRQDITLEEQLAPQLAPAGPLIAVGRPGQKVPPLGAARLWLRDDAWQEAVDMLLEECLLVVMIMGDSRRHEGLAWEVQRIVQLGCVDKLLLVMPPIEEAKARSRWEQFTALLQGRLPEYRRGVLFARFTADGACEMLRSAIGERVPNIYQNQLTVG